MKFSHWTQALDFSLQLTAAQATRNRASVQLPVGRTKRERSWVFWLDQAIQGFTAQELWMARKQIMRKHAKMAEREYFRYGPNLRSLD